MLSNTIKIGKYNIYASSFNDLLFTVKDRIGKNITTSIVTLNPEIYLHSLKNKSHSEAISGVDIVVADGLGIVWANQYELTKSDYKLIKIIKSIFQTIISQKHDIIPQRITGVDLTLELCKLNLLPIKIFGSKNGSGQLARTKLLEKFPNLMIDVYENVDVNNDGIVKQGDVSELYKEKSLILLALGAPKQELLMEKIKNNLVAGSVVIGVGGTVDYISGKIMRAPKFIRKIGLEWLFRLIIEPKRFKRIVNALFVFPYKFIKKY